MQYQERIRKGVARRAKARARQAEADAEVKRAQAVYREKLRSRMPAPKTVPIFDGRPDPFAGKDPTTKPIAAPSTGTSGQDRLQNGMPSRPQVAHRVLETLQTPNTVDDNNSVIGEAGEVNDGEDFERTTETARFGTTPVSTKIEDDLLSFSDDEPVTVKLTSNPPDPFQELRCFFQKDSNSLGILHPTKSEANVSKEQSESSPVPTSTETISTKSPNADGANAKITPSTNLYEIFQDLSSLISSDIPNAEEPSPNHSPANNYSDSNKSASAESSASSGLLPAHTKLAEQIEDRLYKEEAERLEILRHKDPQLYNEIKSQEKGEEEAQGEAQEKPTPSEGLQPKPNHQPSPVIAVTRPTTTFDKPWFHYKDMKIRSAAYVAEQEKEKKDLAKVHSLTTSDIFEANRRNAARLREQAARNLNVREAGATTMPSGNPEGTRRRYTNGSGNSATGDRKGPPFRTSGPGNRVNR